MKEKGFRNFITIWLGQFVSLFGSGMTSFALIIWIYQQTESPTALALAAFFSRAPMLIFGPISGALADRFSRKGLLIVSDSLAGLATLVLLLVHQSGSLALWHIYAAIVISGIADSIQVPALMGSITLMVPKSQYGRASGLQSLAGTASSIFAPLAAAGLLAFSSLQEILWIDLGSFVLAILTLSITFIPQPAASEAGNQARGTFLQDILFGFKFILERPSLLGLQSIWMSANFLATIGNVLLAPLVLSRTGGDTLALSGVEAILSAGAVAGGILISAWGGPKNKVQGALISMALCGGLGRVCFGFGRDIVTWIPGAFFMFFFIPILNGCLAPVWLSKVPADVQGRVMSARITLSRSMVPLGTLLAGPLAEFVFEPAMDSGGLFARVFGNIVGTGPGTGMSVIIIFTGLLLLGLTALGFLIPAIRDAETLLADPETRENLVQVSHN
jgi:DHA3 family macrolide efflux protein-like MFS transporter